MDRDMEETTTQASYPAGIGKNTLREPVAAKQAPISSSFENVTHQLEMLDRAIEVLASRLVPVSNLAPMESGENVAAEKESKSGYRELIDLSAGRISRARRNIETLVSQLEI